MRPTSGRRAYSYLIVTLLLLAASHSAARAQEAAFVAPPRTVADITAILDQQKRDPNATRKLRANADAPPPERAGRAALSHFHYDRSQARWLLGETAAAIADGKQALEYGQGVLEKREVHRLRHSLALQYRMSGEPKAALEVMHVLIREASQPGEGRGFLFVSYRSMVEQYIALGDLNQAEVYVRRVTALFQQARNWSSFSDYRRMSWGSNVEQAKAALHAARGQFREAELAYHRAADLRKGAEDHEIERSSALPEHLLEQRLAGLMAKEGHMKARQGRLAEGEADVRRALLSRLNTAGKFSAQTVSMIGSLAGLLVQQGRLAEAEKLTRTSIEILDTLGIAKDSQIAARSLNSLATILNLQGRWTEATEVHARIDEVMRTWEQPRKDALTLNTGHIFTMYNSDNLTAGLAAAERLLARQKARFGDRHVETAFARGTFAVGLSRARRDADALREFRAALPILTSVVTGSDMDDAVETASQDRRRQAILASYISLLARNNTSEAATESFVLSDLVRNRSVHQALAASSARAVASDPALAELVRKEQDLQKQIGARLGLLNNLLASPPEARDEKAVAALRSEIDKLRSENDKAKQDIKRRFPKYADLINPKPSTPDEVRKALGPDEVLLSFYFDSRGSFVWAVPKDGPVRFARIAGSANEIEGKIKTLRRALEPEASTIRDIPAFDVALAHELYTLLLKPVEAAWRPAKNLIVVTNGALGMLPLGLLPTAAAPAKADGGPLFAEYRDVQWLARSHTVALAPSVSALLAQRQLPAGSPKRETLIGFGDPLFSEQQALDAAAQDTNESLALAAATRGAPLVRRAAAQTDGVDSAELGLLPRLPDTAQELRAIALALGADPSKALHLGKDANERRVKTTRLSDYRIVAFATHGLLPGDLNGLTQPALALSAPKVAGIDGDGLLTMEEILALKLDADWVILSACNTGAGAGAGAEAASGLGRAFFYAGTRALLVTNWSVHSASARDLVTDLFQRQSADPNLGRAEALRAAMMAMIDGPGFTDGAKKTLFTYAHPLFWAPYSIIGDGR
jgi:CHAT domain-containing protein